jgi:antitoxin component YwqK of YwqJK toxin-antitoxin module
MITLPHRQVSYDADTGLYVFEGLPFTGASERRFASGRLASHIEFRQGVKHGTSVDYFPGGLMSTRAECVGGMRHGRVCLWFNTGRPEAEELYEFGSVRARRAWDASGKLVEDTTSSARGPRFRAMKACFAGAPEVPAGFADSPDEAYRRLTQRQ